MAEDFPSKLSFVLKALSLSRGALASALGVDKSLVGRWARGTVSPSRENLSRLSDLVARRVTGFTVLDWDRPLASLAPMFGVDLAAVGLGETAPAQDVLPLPLLELARSTTRLRGRAYEGFFRSTRPYYQSPGDFIHDHIMIRRHDNGLLAFRLINTGVLVEGWLLLLHAQGFVITAELSSGTYAFGVLHGVSGVQADRLDGLFLINGFDVGRTPHAAPMLVERVEDLSGDPKADDARLLELGKLRAIAPAGSVPPEIARHLARDVGPAQIALGGDWLVSMPAARSMSRNVDRTGQGDPVGDDGSRPAG
jgi:transcriptional regulator with XRE-family HTH domain